MKSSKMPSASPSGSTSQDPSEPMEIVKIATPSVKKAGKAISKPTRKYESVSNRTRIQIVIARHEFGLECIWTSKLFGLRYSNVKTIYLAYQKERKLCQSF